MTQLQISRPAQLQISLNRPQTLARRLFTDGARVVLAWGRGVGKTTFILLVALLLVAQYDRIARAHERGIRIVYLMPASTQAKKTVIHRFADILDGIPDRLRPDRLAFAFLRGKFNKVDLRATFPGGSWIQFVSQEQRELLRGMRCDVVLIDEADDIDPSLFDGTVMPWFSEPWSMNRVLMGGTPRRGRSGLLYRSYRMGLDRQEGFASIHATWRNAPEHVSAARAQSERRRLEAAGQLAIYLREWECDFDAGEGLVYPHFNRDIHIAEPAKGAVWTEMLVGCDHGYEDPGVLLLIGIRGHGRDAVAHVLWECYERHREEGWWIAQAAKIRNWYPQAKWYCDPSLPSRVAAYRSAGCKIQDVDNSIQDGVNAVGEFMASRPIEVEDPNGNIVVTGHKTRFFVSPQCTETIRELGLYKRKRDSKNSDLFLDDIEDKNNHAMDALRYALFNRFGPGPDRGRGGGNVDNRPR